jgi:hypothetical protein
MEVGTLPSLIYFSWDFHRDRLHKRKSNIKVDIWHPAVGLRCRNPPRHLSQLKAWEIHLFLHLKPTAGCQMSTLIFDFLLWRRSLWKSHEKYIKDGKVLAHLGIQSKIWPWPLTDLSAWVGFCISSPQQGVKYQIWYLIFLLYFSWDINRNPPSIKKNQISKLIFDTLLWAWCAETHPGT